MGWNKNFWIDARDLNVSRIRYVHREGARGSTEGVAVVLSAFIALAPSWLRNRSRTLRPAPWSGIGLSRYFCLTAATCPKSELDLVFPNEDGGILDYIRIGRRASPLPNARAARAASALGAGPRPRRSQGLSCALDRLDVLHAAAIPQLIQSNSGNSFAFSLRPTREKFRMPVVVSDSFESGVIGSHDCTGIPR